MAEAVWFPERRRVEIRSETLPELSAGDVRVRSVVSGISAGSELTVYRGEAPTDVEPDLPTIGGSFGFPIKFGYATVGRVTEVRAGTDGAGVEGPRAGVEGPRAGVDGPRAGVDRPRVGDLVFVHHPHQTELVVPGSSAIVLPDGIEPELGVFCANLETAVTVVLDANPRMGEVVLVTGQGVLGLLITMLLRRAGAGTVVTVDMHQRRREASLAAGADEALGVDADVSSVVGAASDGRGADIAIDVSGSAGGLQACVDAAAFGGTVVAASWYGTRPVTLALGGAFHRKRLRIRSSQVSTLDPEVSGRWDRGRRLALVTQLLCALPLSGLVTHRFPFGDAAAAYDLLDRTPEECLQVVLVHA